MVAEAPDSVGSYSNALKLRSGYTWGGDGSGITLDYQFFNSLPGYYSFYDYEAYGFQSFNSQMKSATRRVLDEIETFANVTFVEKNSASPYDVDLGFAQATLPADSGAWAYYPSGTLRGGDVWTNNYYSETQNPSEGNYGYYILLHEIGHALGLEHSFEDLSGIEDSSQYTVMAYNTDAYYSSSYMLYDIAALQALYGANMSHATGDDTYVLKKNEAYTVWDAGGNDTFDAAYASFGVTINLNDGEFSSVGMTNNIAIAYNAVIENATSGSGSDILVGNAADNIILANAGSDTIYASAGDDTLNGGIGIDNVVYEYDLTDFLVSIVDSVTLTIERVVSSDVDTVISIENFYFDNVLFTYSDLVDYSNGLEVSGKVQPDIIGTGKSDVLQGDADNNYIQGLGGKDKMYGGDGDDILQAGGSKNQMYGGAGNDQLSGGGSKDKLYGDDGDDILQSNGSKSTLYGGNDNDQLTGSGGKNKLYGDDGDDILSADGSKNTLYGGAGNDQLTGGGGKDKLYGDDGDDILSVGAGSKYALFGGAGNDQLTGGGAKNKLYGEAGDDVIVGGDGGKNSIKGGAGNDTLSASGGKNKLYGDDGDDILYVGASDSLSGGAGNDDFVITDSANSKSSIKDFKVGEDQIDLSDILGGYDPLNDAIEDFVMITEKKGKAILSIDDTGAGDGADFVTVAVIKGLSGYDAGTAEDDGIFIL